MKIYIVRHGETSHNKKGTYYGNLDFDLTDFGRLQAKAVSKELSEMEFQRVFLSDRKRAIETVTIIMENNKFFKENELKEDIKARLVQDVRLKERNFGIFEGLTYDEIKNNHSEDFELWNNKWMEFAPKEGESYLDMCKRAFDFMDELLKLQEENILIVTHAGIMRAIYCYVMNKDINLFWKFACKNADLAILNYEYGNLFIDTIEHCKVK